MGCYPFQVVSRMVMNRSGDVFYIGGNDVLPAPLEPQREAFVLQKLGTGQEEEAKSVLIEHNLRLVVYIARKFDNTGVGVEDLISIGTIGLIKAINTFNPVKNIKLATYASRCIENEILMYLRSNRKTRANVSIDDAVGRDREGNELRISDLMGTDPDIVAQQAETRIGSAEAIALMDRVLDARERHVLRLRYGIEDGICRAQRDVAALLGISRSYVSRIEKKALEKLKKHMA